MSVELGIREGHDGFGGHLYGDISKAGRVPFIANAFISRSESRRY